MFGLRPSTRTTTRGTWTPITAMWTGTIRTTTTITSGVSSLLEIKWWRDNRRAGRSLSFFSHIGFASLSSVMFFTCFWHVGTFLSPGLSSPVFSAAAVSTGVGRQRFSYFLVAFVMSWLAPEWLSYNCPSGLVFLLSFRAWPGIQVAKESMLIWTPARRPEWQIKKQAGVTDKKTGQSDR